MDSELDKYFVSIRSRQLANLYKPANLHGQSPLNQFYQTPITGRISPQAIGKEVFYPGVYVEDYPGIGLHAAFIHDGRLYNINDAAAWGSELPPDGFHQKKYLKYERPIMTRPQQIKGVSATTAGECSAYAAICSMVMHSRLQSKTEAERLLALEDLLMTAPSMIELHSRAYALPLD